MLDPGIRIELSDSHVTGVAGATVIAESFNPVPLAISRLAHALSESTRNSRSAPILRWE